MPASRLDPIDRQILAELQADGRMTNVELARRVGISAPPCLRRKPGGVDDGHHCENLLWRYWIGVFRGDRLV